MRTPQPQYPFQRAFTAGEVTPAAAARADHISYLTGLRTCRNFIIGRHGGAVNRPGTLHLGLLEDQANRPFFFPFVFNAEQSYVIEGSATKFRFWRNGALVLDGSGDPYEVTTPYSTAELYNVRADAQSADVLIFTCAQQPTYELRRFDHADWTFTPMSFAPWAVPPAHPMGTEGAAGTRTMKYVVTAAKADTYEETLPSDVITLTTCAAPTVAAPHVLTWDPVVGAAEYYIYCDPFENGVFGFVGTATGQTTFRDTGLAPDYDQTPPIDRALFGLPTLYPAIATFYQQRLLLAASDVEPETVFASQTGFFRNFNIRSPLQDDDAVTFTLAANQVNRLRYMVGLKQLILMTAAGWWVVRGDESGVLTPTGIHADQEGFHGIVERPGPALVGDAMLYQQARGSAIRELRFGQQTGAFATRDLTLLSFHLFEGYTFNRLAYADVPFNCLWCVRGDGVLLGLTYVPEHEVFAWHQHTTGQFGTDVIEDCCVISEGYEDKVYLGVKRILNGQTYRFMEQFATRVVLQDPPADAHLVDCGIVQTNVTPSDVVTGLDHLEGQVVSVLSDGQVVYDGDPAGADAALYTVESGEIQLPFAASVVHVGLRIYQADLEALDLDVQGSDVRAKRKRIHGLKVLVEASSHGFKVGPDENHLLRTTPESWEGDTLKRGIVEANLTAGWNDRGSILIRHTDPTPLSVLGIIPIVDVGGG